MLRRTLLVLVPILVSGCATLPGSDPLKVFLVGVEPLPGQGLELRLAVKLRVQNPNEAVVEFDGVALDLIVRGLDFASGVSNERGSVPRFGETVITVPVSVSAAAMVRQAYAWAAGERTKLDFVARGKLGGGMLLPTRFTAAGEFEWPGARPASAP
jgi:LEA14-like dessication related protein